jgi:hypothetical protein
MFFDKAPYIVTILMAALTWSLTHIADRLLATPMIRYEVQNLSTQGRQAQYLTFKNITRDKTFRGLRLVLTAAADGQFTQGAVIPFQPASEGDRPYQLAGRTFEFTFPEFQPGWKIEISVGYTGSAPPTLRLSSADQTIYAVVPSLETLLVEYDLEVLIGLAVIWIIALVVIWLFWLFLGRNIAVAYDT